MTDRELLELAAKAAGIPLFNSGIKDSETAFTFWDISNHDPYEHKVWNPLNDDGDALRLAVKLEMDIWESWDYVEVIHNDIDFQIVEKDSDPYAATRRAIVRAAAEIGKTM